MTAVDIYHYGLLLLGGQKGNRMDFGTLCVRFHPDMLQLSFALGYRQLVLFHEGLYHLQSRGIQFINLS